MYVWILSVLRLIIWLQLIYDNVILLRLERQLKRKEIEVWALNRNLKETKSKNNW